MVEYYGKPNIINIKKITYFREIFGLNSSKKYF